MSGKKKKVVKKISKKVNSDISENLEEPKVEKIPPHFDTQVPATSVNTNVEVSVEGIGDSFQTDSRPK